MDLIISYVAFAFIEFLILYLITNRICIINYEYASLKYTSFSFSTAKDSPTGLNMLLKIFFPPSYIVILAGILYSIYSEKFISNIFLITIFYYLIKWLICLVVFNRGKLINWGNEFLCFFLSVLISFGADKLFISKTTEIFISLEELRDGIWIGIISFFFTVLIGAIYNHSKLDLSKQKYKIKNYIKKKYKKFDEKYGEIINGDDNSLKQLTYAIMIYENYNRPLIIRFFEYIKFYIIGHATLGLMQVSTNKYIDDKESVQLGYNIIKNQYELVKKNRLLEIKKENKKQKKKTKSKNNVNDTDTDYLLDEVDLKEVIEIYNKSDKYTDEVLYIYCILQEDD